MMKVYHWNCIVINQFSCGLSASQPLWSFPVFTVLGNIFHVSLLSYTACLGRIRVSHGFCHRSMAKPIYHGKTHDIWVLPCNGFSHSSMAKPMDTMKRNIHGFCHGPLLHGFCPLNQRWRKFFCCQLYLFWQLYLVERLLLFFQFFSLKWILHVIFESLKIDLMLLAFLIPKCVSSDSLDKS